MTKNDLFKYYQETGTEALETAEELFKIKRYDYCLFFCHLALEKILKGLVFKTTKTHAPPIHDLAKLAKKAKISKISEDDLEEITTWNIKARYDSIKREFYQKADKEFTKKWLIKTKEFFLWLKNQY